jgi:hypothetical protein
MLIDRENSLEVELVASDMTLLNATATQLAAGWNKALVGSEIIQFARAEPLGGANWRLSWLLRGRGGSESAIANHVAGERFVLLNQIPRLLDPALVGTGPDTQIVAVGRGDPDPVSADIALAGISLRPLRPVHTSAETLADGSLRLCWTRRARGAWLWVDGAETPLVEETERYQVDFGPIGAPLASWIVTTNQLVLSAATRTSLQAQLANGPLNVRQSGSYAASEPAFIANLA